MQLGGASLSLLLGGCATLQGSRARRPLGLVDITVGRELRQDYAGTLRQLAAMGYTVFSFGLTGFGGREPGEPTPQEKARMVRDAGMEVGVVRLRVRNPEPERELADAAEIGARIVTSAPAAPFLSGPTMFRTTRDEFEAWLPKIVALGETARRHGLTLAYHSHWFDLAPLSGGDTAYDLLARQVPPDLLSFEVDFANAWYAGVAPLDLLERLGPRVVSMHWKDIDRSRGGDILEQVATPGEGDMNYAALIPRVLELTRATGCVEVDNPPDGLLAASSAARLILPLLGRGAG